MFSPHSNSPREPQLMRTHFLYAFFSPHDNPPLSLPPIFHFPFVHHSKFLYPSNPPLFFDSFSAEPRADVPQSLEDPLVHINCQFLSLFSPHRPYKINETSPRCILVFLLLRLLLNPPLSHSPWLDPPRLPLDTRISEATLSF